MTTFTDTRTPEHSTELAMMRGARLVVAQETEQGGRWAEARIKTLTGGDPITAHYMRQDFFTFSPQFKLIIAGNHKPQLRHVDEAMRRRMHIVPFVRTFGPGDRDIGLEAALKTEWPGILAWAIEGARVYRERGLDAPPAVTDATASYFAAQDELAAWLEAQCVTGEACEARSSVLYGWWVRYAEANHYAPGTSKVFGDRLEALGFARVRRADAVYWRGLAPKQDLLSSA